jgi:hypothetical protein
MLQIILSVQHPAKVVFECTHPSSAMRRLFALNRRRPVGDKECHRSRSRANAENALARYPSPSVNYHSKKQTIFFPSTRETARTTFLAAFWRISRRSTDRVTIPEPRACTVREHLLFLRDEMDTRCVGVIRS